MTLVKICGLTNLPDALAALNAGANALGFIAVPGSRRYVSPELFSEIRAALPPFVSTVVVGRTVAETQAYAADVVQFYEGPADPNRRSVRVFRVRNLASLDELIDYSEPVSAILLDTFHETALGGVGKTFDWNLLEKAHNYSAHPIIVAGGLTPENVADAIRMGQPYAVDVSSGVESEPGRKDAEKLRRFVDAVREASK